VRRSVSIPMARYIAALLTAVLGIGAGGCLKDRDQRRLQRETPDLLLVGGVVHTMDSLHPLADAVGIVGDRISYVGDRAGIEGRIGDQTRVIDVKGQAVIPGMMDTQINLVELGRRAEIVDLVGTSSIDDIRARLSTACAAVEPGRWVHGRGWDQNDWAQQRFPTVEDLDGVCDANPVYMVRICRNVFWVNRPALARTGVTAATRDPAGGRIGRFEMGQPDGLFFSEALNLVDQVIPGTSAEDLARWVPIAQQRCLELGLTSVGDSGTTQKRLTAYETTAQAGELHLRIYVMIEDDPAEVAAVMQQGPRIGLYDHHLTVRTIKENIDGTMGARDAAMLEPYSDDPENLGVLTIEYEELVQVTERALERGFQMDTHAIGDRATRMVLDAYEEALRKRPTKDHRFRIEHAQRVHPDDIPRFERLGVIPIMQPTQATSDMPRRRGPTRLHARRRPRLLRGGSPRVAGGGQARRRGGARPRHPRGAAAGAAGDSGDDDRDRRKDRLRGVSVRDGVITAGLMLLLATGAIGGCQRGATGGGEPVETKADTILINGVIHTMDPENPRASALAIRGHRLVYVGDLDGVQAHWGDDTRVIDAAGATVLPGLIDANAHFLGLGKVLESLDLTGTASAAEVAGRVRAYCAEVPAGEWIYGRGWDQNDWPETVFPTWRDLDGCSEHPVTLTRVDGHAMWVNRVALQRAGINAATPDPAGGRIVRDDAGEPTGVLIDNAIDLVAGLVPDPTAEQLQRRALRARDECLRMGLTGVVDAGIDAETLAVYEALGARGELGLRIYAMIVDQTGEEAFLAEQLAAGPRVGLYDHHLTIRTVKCFADGALGSRGAALLEPYSDDPGNSGLIIHDLEHLLDVSRRALEAGFQMGTHAIGDRGNRMVLDAYEQALRQHPTPDHRFRIEHAQVLHPDDLPRFAALGVVPAMQPTHATSDMPWAPDRLGPERIAGAYAWRSFLDSGARIPMGSDFPVESPNPLWGMYAAVTCQDHQGLPADGFRPDQRLTFDEALRGFTLDAAYGSFEEDLKGSLEVGKLADLVVLDRDIAAVPPREWLSAQVRLTMVGGEIRYDAR